MIRFISDWRKYPSAIVDTKTPNKSFIEVCALYRDMGVKHWYFPLTLLQPELQGVNPHSEDLTLEQKTMIIDEVDNNPWYYLREICIDKGAGLELDDMRFRANRANIAAMWMIIACIDYIQVQPRQTGKSFGADNNSLWLMYFCYRDTTINLITKDETLRKSNIARLKKLRDGWPDWLSRNTKKDDNNQISLSCHALNNKYYTHVSQSSEKAANNLGRGMTSPFLQVDEAPFINHIETTISSAMGSLIAARDIAKKKGHPYCSVFTTTAGNQEDRDGRYMFNMMMGAAVWSERFFDCVSRDELVSLIRTNSSGRSVMVNLTMSAYQLGMSEEWLYEAIANARSEGDNVDRDYFNVWTSSSNKSLIPAHLAKIIRKSETDAIDQFISKESYIFNWYEDVDPNGKYVAIVDTSDAIGRDDIAVIVLNSTNGAVAGAGSFNETNLIRFAEWLFELMCTYENLTLAIERRYNAQTIIDFLLLRLPEKGYDPFVRMFNQVVQNRDERDKDYAKIQTGNKTGRFLEGYRRDFGFVTGKDTRKLLFNNVMMNAAKDSGDKMRDGKLISQLLNLEVKNGRVDHGSGGHDDMVIAWLIGHWFLNHGMNLSHYGIDSSEVMKEKSSHGKKLTPTELLEKRQQDDIKRDIQRVHDILKDTSDSVEVMRLERELGILVSRVKDTDSSGMSLDALIKEARETRSLKRGGGYGKSSSAYELINKYGY